MGPIPGFVGWGTSRDAKNAALRGGLGDGSRRAALLLPFPSARYFFSDGLVRCFPLRSKMSLLHSEKIRSVKNAGYEHGPRQTGSKLGYPSVVEFRSPSLLFLSLSIMSLLLYCNKCIRFPTLASLRRM